VRVQVGAPVGPDGGAGCDATELSAAARVWPGPLRAIVDALRTWIVKRAVCMAYMMRWAHMLHWCAWRHTHQKTRHVNLRKLERAAASVLVLNGFAAPLRPSSADPPAPAMPKGDKWCHANHSLWLPTMTQP
jgi:hypothetical protein